jgi:hypothetical protein
MRLRIARHRRPPTGPPQPELKQPGQQADQRRPTSDCLPMRLWIDGFAARQAECNKAGCGRVRPISRGESSLRQISTSRTRASNPASSMSPTLLSPLQHSWAVVSLSLFLFTGRLLGQELVFDPPTAAQELLAKRDPFIERLSPFDRAARMKTHSCDSLQALWWSGNPLKSNESAPGST